MNRPFLTANASARGSDGSLVYTARIHDHDVWSPRADDAGGCAAKATFRPPGQRPALNAPASAALRPRNSPRVYFPIVVGILIHDPQAVLSQLPRACVVSRRRRADADGSGRRSAARRRAVPRVCRRARPADPHVFLTHLHADFVAGHLELRDRTGATIYLGAAAKAEYPFTPLNDGDAVEFGRVRLTGARNAGTHARVDFDPRVTTSIAAPPTAGRAHRRHAVCRRRRPSRSARALGWSAADLGALLYDSLRTKLLPLPDDTLVYPAHGAGSLCGKAISKETVSTIGEQRRSNYALQPMSKAAFIELVTADQPDAPPYFTYDAVLNSKERPTLDESLARELSPLSLDQVWR